MMRYRNVFFFVLLLCSAVMVGCSDAENVMVGRYGSMFGDVREQRISGVLGVFAQRVAGSHLHLLQASFSSQQ